MPAFLNRCIDVHGYVVMEYDVQRTNGHGVHVLELA